jgi:hypothetical protein
MVKKAISSLLPSAGGNTVGDKSSSGVGGQNVSEDWTRFGKRQILSVGSKKRHRHHDDDDEILAVDVAAGGDGSSSDEEDQGRTSAVREKKRRTQHPPAVSTAIARAAASACANDEASADVAASASAAPSKKKKKKGKKERVKEGSPEVEPSKEEMVAIDLPANEKKNDVDFDAGENDARNRDGDPKIEVDTSDKKKRWKKKVRSRQKNIRKDHRAVADRPHHVVSGGRPLTEATRQKLGLQTTTTTNADSTIDPSSLIDIAFDSGKWVGDGGETAHTANGGERGGANSFKEDKPKTSSRRTTLTKVGDCIVDVESISEQSNKEVAKNSKEKIEENKKKGKTQKRRFKNIALG